LCVFIKISCIVYTQAWIQVFLIQVFFNRDLDAKLVSCIPDLRFGFLIWMAMLTIKAFVV
jgi:hypothetical protein